MNRGNPLGLGLVLAGAALLVVSTFLPLNEPVGLFRFVQQNTLIQHDGWLYVVGAIALAAAGFRAFLSRNDWALPLIVSIVAAIGVIIWATNTDMRTLYPVGPDGTADSSKPGEIAAWGISIYVAALGVLLGVVGSLTLRQTGSDDAKKKCPDCAETVLAEAQLCKHCGHRFPSQSSSPAPTTETGPTSSAKPATGTGKTRRIKCAKCQSILRVTPQSEKVTCPNCEALLTIPPPKKTATRSPANKRTASPIPKPHPGVLAQGASVRVIATEDEHQGQIGVVREIAEADGDGFDVLVTFKSDNDEYAYAFSRDELKIVTPHGKAETKN